jgi:hypothetical protein
MGTIDLALRANFNGSNEASLNFMGSGGSHSKYKKSSVKLPHTKRKSASTATS